MSVPSIFYQSDFISSSFIASSKKSNNKTLNKLPFILVILAIVLVSGIIFFSTNGAKSDVAGIQTNANIPTPVAAQKINRTFSFPLNDQSGKKVSTFTYTIDTVELRNDIAVKGQKATATDGKVFLIINLKITNDYNKSISINSRDFIRVMVNNLPEKLAPDIHSDPVEVQAISTKYTKVALLINETDKDITLQVGEIAGKKEMVSLQLQ